MAAISIQGVTRHFGAQVVLQDVSLELLAGEIVGLVGANGAGKTTLFRLIVGELAPDTGTITVSRGVEIGFLHQEPDISLDRTLHDEVCSAFEELLAMEDRLSRLAEEISANADQPNLSALMARYDRLSTQFITAGGHTCEARLNEILGGLAFSAADHTRPMSGMSGGEKCRAALARLLLQDRPFLLLDEPTNHLDIDAVRWLERFLEGHRGGAVVISHDRYLLDRLCDRIVEVDRTRVRCYAGNYTTYAQVKQRDLLTQGREYEKDTAFIKKERAFIAKHLSGQRTKEAKGRRTRLERRLRAGEFVTERAMTARTVRMGFAETQSGEGAVLRCDQLRMSFGNRVLFADLAFQVFSGDRLGITGPNGTGKTTLLKIILRKLEATSGEAQLDPKLSVGYYAQENVELEPDQTVLDTIRQARSEFTELQARSFAARYLFTGDDVFKTPAVLSGGEQSRLRLARLILQGPQVLVLDEPTNHLDIPSREVLEQALLDFGGTIIAVSHDRYFLDRIVNRLLVLRDAGHEIYEGNYSGYVEHVEREKASAKVETSARRAVSGGGVVARPVGKRAASPYDRLSIDELEAMVIERETELALLHEKFADRAVYRDPGSLAALKEEVASLEAELAEIDAAWQERAESQ
ncbi:MAG: ribosomal protection-like ABC-F family protein [Phycisphaerae bacterium]